MSESLTQLSLDDLLKRFADDAPTPGGGSASALAGALAASLTTMVGNLTVGKKGYEDVAEDADFARTKASLLGLHLGMAVEADAGAFDEVMAAMGLPKGTDEEKEARKAAMQKAFKYAAEVPLTTARECLQIGKLALKLLTIGNKNAATDAGVAVLLAVAGAEGALFNVAINLGSIKDEDWLAQTRSVTAPLWQELEALRAQLWPALKAAGVEIPR